MVDLGARPERAKEMRADLARYLLRAVTSRSGEVHVEHIQSGQVDFLFLKVSGSDQGLAARDRDALVTVIEAMGGKDDRAAIVDWR